MGVAVSGTVSRKLGARPGARSIFVGAPETALDAIDPPQLDLASDLTGEFDYIHVFATTRSELEESLPELTSHLKPTGMLWVSWPKSRKLETDLVLAKVISIGYSHGLVESKCVSVDATWSALKFTLPKPGKTYSNSYGQLPPSSH